MSVGSFESLWQSNRRAECGRRKFMKDGFKVIDADRHILEPSDLYQRYLPEKFKQRVRLAGPNQTVREVDGKPVSDSALRPGRGMEDYGYIFSSSKRWRACFADAS